MDNKKAQDMYHSQFGEDKILADIFREKSHGLCIEVGANDGVNDSTTLYFEKIGWDCILVEPNPVLCQMIRAARSSRLYEFAASSKSGIVTLFIAEGAERAHGVSTISSDEASLNKIKSYGFTYKKIQVQTRTLDEILSELEHDREIDFISIDVEGHELDVLKGFSIERWSPTVLILEDNSNFENADVKNHMKQFGYVRFMRTGVNDWYAHKKNKKLVNLHSIVKYNLGILKIKTKRQIKKVPGVVKIRNFLLKRFAKRT